MSIIELLPAGMAVAGLGLRFYLSAPTRERKAEAPVVVPTKRAPSRLLALLRRPRVSIAHGGTIRA